MTQRYQHLGKSSSYSQGYNPQLLDPISRNKIRKSLNLNIDKELYGFDRWFCFEISALNSNLKPFNLMLYFDVLCSSPYMVESKSLKLYLNGFNNCIVDGSEELIHTLNKDLSNCLESPVYFKSFDIKKMFKNISHGFSCLDNQDALQSFKFNASQEMFIDAEEHVFQEYYTELFRSLCPVTNQPDWASVFLKYMGKKINVSSLLNYLCSYRECAMFHESCVEKIYNDIYKFANCKTLSVYAHFLRRGGISLMPVRTSSNDSLDLIYDSRF